MRSGDTRTFAVMAKVVGGRCNLACAYCYYVEKPKLLRQALPVMPDDVLEAYVRRNLEINGLDATVEFAWHGGEPTLAGLDFFRKAMALERRYGAGRKIVNTIQTNATLLDEDWCAFFAQNGFLVGVSVDGPKEFHDAYRRDAAGGTFDRTMAGIALLRKRRVPFNTLTTVNASNMGYGRDVYGFLREYTDFMQFLPVVESEGTAFEAEDGQRFATPPGIRSANLLHPAVPFSVTAAGYGAFLCDVFDCWKRRDVGKKFVQIFEVTIGAMQGTRGGLCVHDALCGHAASVEVNGDVYSCERYAYPNYRLGNILETPLAELMEGNRAFGMHKTYGLPKECFECPYIRLCFGGCPKDRILRTKDGQRGRNYLCDGYKQFFQYFTNGIQI
jgi:uncharacterized protein